MITLDEPTDEEIAAFILADAMSIDHKAEAALAPLLLSDPERLAFYEVDAKRRAAILINLVRSWDNK